MIDLKPMLGEPYKIITEIQTTTESAITIEKEVPNVEFISNGIILLFTMIVLGNILLRTIFPKKRG